MSDPWTVSSLLVAAGLILVALRTRGSSRRAIVLVLLAGLVLRLSAGLDGYLHQWDERYHALVAKNLLEHPLTPTLYDDPALPYDPSKWVANHVWLHKPPLALWLISLSLRLFGLHEIVVRLPSLLISTMGILVTYLVGRRIFDHKVALLAAALQAINGQLIELTAGRAPADHVDTLLVFLVGLGVLFALIEVESDSPLLSVLVGACTGLGLLTKSLPALLVPIVWLACSLHRPWQRILQSGLWISLAAAAVAVPWQIYINLHFPEEAALERSFVLRHFFEAVDCNDQPWHYYLGRIGRRHGQLIYLPIGWFLFRLGRIRSPALWALGAWLLVPYVVFSIPVTKMPAFTAIAAPAVVLVAASFWWHLRERLADESVGWRRILGWAVLALLLALPARYTVDRMAKFAGRERTPAWAQDLRVLVEDAERRIAGGKAAVFNVERPIEAMFYLPHAVYPDLPTEPDVARLVAKGYEVVIVDRGTLPVPLKDLPGVTVLPPRRSSL